MRLSGFSVLTLLAATGSTFAADLPAAYTKAPAYVPADITNWTGFDAFGSPVVAKF